MSVPNRQNTTKDIVNLAFDLRTEIIIFEVTHKPGYQLKARFGIHVGNIVTGLLQCKPHQFVMLGDDVEIAWQMERTGEPLKIQATEAVIDKLGQTVDDVEKLFDYTQRSTVLRGVPNDLRTYWLNGRHSTPNVDVAVQDQTIVSGKV